jgi:HEAT repeat protein
VAAIEAGGLTDAASLDALGGLISDDDPRVRIGALGSLARRRALSPSVIVSALDDPTPAVRQRAAQLAHLTNGDDDPELDEALLSALHDAIPLCVVAALEAIATRGGLGAVDRVIELATGAADPLVLEEAVATLASLGDRRGLPAVLAATHGRPALRRRSVSALGAFDGAEVEEALDRLAQDRDWQVRQAVAMLRRGDNDLEPPADWTDGD